MTLSRKIFFRNAVLIGGVLVLSGAALVGLWRLRGEIDVAFDEYAEARLLGSAEVRVMDAQGKLLASEPDYAAARAKLLDAGTLVKQYLELQTYADEGSQSHENSEQSGAVAAGSALSAAAGKLAIHDGQRLSEADRSAIESDVRKAVQKLQELGRDADTLIGRTARSASSSIRNTLIVVGLVAALIMLSTFAISWLQYMGVMRPLRALMAGVRNVAAGRFSQRLEPSGDREFAVLANEFNRMAGELDGLYKGLEAKVEAKSRDLVRSERLASVGFLAAGVAHEINNPLHIMAGYAELSLKRLRHIEQTNDPAVSTAVSAALQDALESLSIIRDESFRCKQITEKLLSLSQPGTKPREHEPVSLARAARDVRTIVQGHQASHDRMIDLALDDSDALMAMGSEPEIKQVLLNLVINALEAVEPHDGRVTIHGEREREWIKLVIADNGCGMAPDILEHVFEPFFSNKRDLSANVPDGARRGLGLGLSISHLIVASHGGTLTAASGGDMPAGSRFTITLPAAKDNRSDRRGSESSRVHAADGSERPRGAW